MHAHTHSHTRIYTHAQIQSCTVHTHTCTHKHTCTHVYTNTFYYSIDSLVWTTNLSAVMVRPFTKHVGPTLPIPRSPLEIFLLIFTTTILQSIVDQTNLCASQCMGASFDTWQQVTIHEMKAYMGFMILMGIIKPIPISDYWKRDETLNYAPISSRDRFLEIQRYLHFTDNSTLVPPGADGYDRLGKIRPVIRMINEHLLALYNPQQGSKHR